MSDLTFPKHLISIDDLNKDHIEELLNLALILKTKKNLTPYLQGKLLATLFYEPSTRTRLSFEAAMLRLGGSVISESDTKASAHAKGESFSDSLKVTSQYVDAIVIRHPLEGSAKLASEICNVPVINAGDGSNEHPTQTLLDLFTIKECQGKIDDLHIAFVGDLKHGRTVHSLAKALAHYKVRLYFVSQTELTLPDQIAHELSTKGVRYSFHKNYLEIVDKLDIIYMTRLQKERISHPSDKLSSPYQLKKADLATAKDQLKVMHPLPRVDEIDLEIDMTKHAYYFQQAENGLYTREAILLKLLSKQDKLQGLLHAQGNTVSLSHS